MLNTFRRIAVAAAIGAFALPASAATFDFTDGLNGANGNYNGNFNATVGGIAVDITAGVYDGLGAGPNDDTIIFDDCSAASCFQQVAKRDGGLGVGIPISLPYIGTVILNPELDGELYELITFTFSQSVNLSAISFASLDADDNFDLFIDGVLVSEENNIASQNPFTAIGAGTSFSIGADSVEDSFLIASVTVSDVTISAVPLPTSALFLLAGVGGLGLIRRRKG